MRLTDLLSFLPCVQDLPACEIQSITENSRQCDSNSLFVCIRGQSFDGHSYAQDAYRRGCRAFLAEQPLNLPSDATVISVPNTRQALGLAACAFYGHPSHRLPIIGITGTKGKTTTACMIAEVLNQNGIPCGYIGTNGIAYADVRLPLKNTTPDAVTLQKTLHEMLLSGCRAAVLEISSQALMQHRTAGLTVDTAIFTNLSPDHIGIGEHDSFEEYAACKHRLFTDYQAKTVIANKDDPHTAQMLTDCSASRILFYSTQDKADYTAEQIIPAIEHHSLGVQFLLRHGQQTQSVSLPLIGRVNASNALPAIACTKECFKISLAASAKALQIIRISGRSEPISLPQNALAVIDYAHNGVSLRQLLQSLREYAPRHLICLFGSVGGRTALRRQELGRAAAELSDFCILTSDNPAEEPPEKIIKDILLGFDGLPTPYQIIPDRREAILCALKLLQSGDILVLAGKGHEDYQLVGKEKKPFSERQILSDALALQQSN